MPIHARLTFKFRSGARHATGDEYRELTETNWFDLKGKNERGNETNERNAFDTSRPGTFHWMFLRIYDESLLFFTRFIPFSASRFIFSSRFVNSASKILISVSGEIPARVPWPGGKEIANLESGEVQGLVRGLRVSVTSQNGPEQDDGRCTMNKLRGQWHGTGEMSGRDSGLLYFWTRLAHLSTDRSTFSIPRQLFCANHQRTFTFQSSFSPLCFLSSTKLKLIALYLSFVDLQLQFW